MKRLEQSKRRSYQDDLASMLTMSEQRRFRQAIRVAHRQSKTFTRGVTHFSSLRTGVSAEAGQVFVKAYKSNRKTVSSFKEFHRSAVRVRGTGDEVTWCPYCGLNGASDLDHYLEKSKVPELALFAGNLVPCCPTCNRVRGRTFEKNGQRRILYFYGDRIDRLECLVKSTVRFDKNGPSISFCTKRARGDVGRVFCRHFEAVRLASNFRDEASDLLKAFRGQFSGLSDRIATQVVRKDLTETDCRCGVNSCRSAVLRALLSSPELMKWVCQ